MSETILKSRLIQKHDIEANWIKAGNAANPFIPLKGEIIVYDLDENYDYERFKIGDGSHNVNQLPFASSDVIVDVISLPEVGDEDFLYRLVKATLIEKQIRRTDCSCTVVSILPTPSGSYPAESIISAEDAQLILQGQTPTVFNVYYKVGDKAYCYIPAALGQAFRLPAGWYDLTLIKNYVPALTYTGTITDITENNIANGTFNILLEYALYWYKDGVWNTVEQIGMIGEGPSAVKFNHPANIASGRASAAFGDQTKATGSNSFAEGYLTEASEKSAHAEGSNTHATGPHSHAEGYDTTASGKYSHSEGVYTLASLDAAHAEGFGSQASGIRSHAEGSYTEATEFAAHAEGSETTASGLSSHAEGSGSKASGIIAHAEGEQTTASGNNSHAEGSNTVASGVNSHAEGYNTIADGYGSHAEGGASKAYAMYSHAGGEWSIAGYENQDSWTDENSCSFAHGYKAIANGKAAISLGNEVIANADYQTVVGSFNSENPSALFVVGNGNSEARRNAFEVHSDGRAVLGSNPVEAKDAATKEYVDRQIEEADAIVILDYTSDTNHEEFQALVDKVKGTLVINVTYSSLYNININNKIAAVYIQGTPSSIRLVGPGKDSNTKLIFVTDHITNFAIAQGFYSVEGLEVADSSSISDCKYVINSDITEAENCDYIENCYLIMSGMNLTDSGIYIHNAKSVNNCICDLYYLIKVSIEATYINNIQIRPDSSMSAYEDKLYVKFKDAELVSNVYYTETTDISKEFIYENCKHLDNCYGYNSLNLIEGEGENTIIQDNSNNKAYASNAIVFGSDNIAGAKGFRITAISSDGMYASGQDESNQILESGYYDITHSGLSSDELNQLLDKEYSLYVKTSGDRIGKVVSIESPTGNSARLNVSPYIHPNKWSKATAAQKEEYYNTSYIFFDALPTIGDVAVGDSININGNNNKAFAFGASAEGYNTIAIGKYAHSEGYGTAAYYAAHSEGKLSKATAYHSHAEGYDTLAAGDSAHSEGYRSKATGNYAHAEGNITEATGTGSHTEGFDTLAEGSQSHAEGNSTKAIGARAHAEGYQTEATGHDAHTEGNLSKATSNMAHAEGYNTLASERSAHAEGEGTVASGKYSHAEGSGTDATGESSHSEGNKTTASGINSHAEGYNTNATGNTAHSSGSGTTAAGDHSYAGGLNSQVPTGAFYAFAHGYQAKATKKGSFALGRDVTTTNDFQTVVGSFNDTSVKNANFVVGSGSTESNRKNSFVSYTDGRATIGADPKNSLDVATKQYVDTVVAENQPELPSIEGLATEEYVDQKIEESRFSGNYNDLTNKPDIPTSDDFDPKNKSATIKLVPSDNTRLEKGWYTIATLPKSSSSLVLHGRYGAIGGRWTSFLISVEMTYMAGDCGSVPSVKVLNCSQRTGTAGSVNLTNCACTKARIRYPADKSKITSNAYLDIYLNYTNNTKTDGSIDGTIQLYSKVISNTDNLDHVAGSCTLADNFSLIEAENLLTSSEVLLEMPVDVNNGTPGLVYTLNADKCGYTCDNIGKCTVTDIIIASICNGLPVTNIREQAFYYCTSLTSVTIPDSVTAIGDQAFSHCLRLTRVVIGESVTRIGNSAFSDCSSLTSIIIPDNIRIIGAFAFLGCNRLIDIDFTDYKAIPSIYAGNAFAESCKIKVPEDLYSEWIAATNWANYADQIIATPRTIGKIGDYNVATTSTVPTEFNDNTIYFVI